MNDYENTNELLQEDAHCEVISEQGTPSRDDPYTYYAGTPNTPSEYRYVPAPKKKKKKQTWILTLVMVLCCSLLSGAMGVGGVLLMQQLQAEEAPEAPEQEISYIMQGIRENSVIEMVEVETGKLMTPAQVYAANVNSTVGITTSVTTNFWGYQSTSAASGSGFIISDDGYILTNFHVIEDSSSISVSMYNGDSYEATLIGYDESNDIAVLKIDAEGLAPVILGDSDNLNVGDSVVAIGNPLGELTFTLTAGAVSAKDREITLSGNVTMNLIQTDCAINSGNSGGALFNLYGEVIGVTNAKYGTSSSSSASIDNIGFAIPINSIMNIVESIIEKGYISKPYIGISILDVSAETQKYGIPAGAAVQAVAENGPAAQAGLQSGDVITAVNGTAMTSNELVSFIGQASIGQQIVFSIYRQGEVLEITVDVGEQIQSALEQEQEQQQTQTQQGYPGNFPWGMP